MRIGEHLQAIGSYIQTKAHNVWDSVKEALARLGETFGMHRSSQSLTDRNVKVAEGNVVGEIFSEVKQQKMTKNDVLSSVEKNQEKVTKLISDLETKKRLKSDVQEQNRIEEKISDAKQIGEQLTWISHNVKDEDLLESDLKEVLNQLDRLIESEAKAEEPIRQPKPEAQLEKSIQQQTMTKEEVLSSVKNNQAKVTNLISDLEGQRWNALQSKKEDQIEEKISEAKQIGEQLTWISLHVSEEDSQEGILKDVLGRLDELTKAKVELKGSIQQQTMTKEEVLSTVKNNQAKVNLLSYKLKNQLQKSSKREERLKIQEKISAVEQIKEELKDISLKASEEDSQERKLKETLVKLDKLTE